MQIMRLFYSPNNRFINIKINLLLDFIPIAWNLMSNQLLTTNTKDNSYGH